MCLRPLRLGNFLVFVLDELGVIVCETTQWYAVAVKVGLGNINNGAGLSADQLVQLIEVAVVVHCD